MPAKVTLAKEQRWPPGFRLLHVEDDALLRKSFELRVMRKLKVPFDVAENGAVAVRLIFEEKRSYDLVLMDNQMPILTGQKATHALRAGGFKGMIVGMTGDPSGCTERDDFEASGLNLCVDKDTNGIRRVSELISSFAYCKEEPEAAQTASHLRLSARSLSSHEDHALPVGAGAATISSFTGDRGQ